MKKMTAQERALKVAMQWQDCTDPTNLRVLALMGLVQLAIEAATEDLKAFKRRHQNNLCRCSECRPE